jgi:hypothetical protein
MAATPASGGNVPDASQQREIPQMTTWTVLRRMVFRPPLTPQQLERAKVEQHNFEAASKLTPQENQAASDR